MCKKTVKRSFLAEKTASTKTLEKMKWTFEKPY